MQLLLSTVLLLLFCTLSNAQMQVAPGDEDSSCVRQNPAEPDNVKMLMNSRNYEQLLAVWDQRDFDDNNPPNPYNPTFVSNIILLVYIESLLVQLCYHLQHSGAGSHLSSHTKTFQQLFENLGWCFGVKYGVILLCKWLSKFSNVQLASLQPSKRTIRSSSLFPQMPLHALVVEYLLRFHILLI